MAYERLQAALDHAATGLHCARCGGPRKRKAARYCLDCAIEINRRRGKPPPQITTAELWRRYKAGELVEREP